MIPLNSAQVSGIINIIVAQRGEKKKRETTTTMMMIIIIKEFNIIKSSGVN